MSAPTKEQVLEALKVIEDPELHQDLVTLGMVKNVKVSDSQVHVVIELTTPACPARSAIRDDVERAVRAVPGVSAVCVEMTARVRGVSPEHTPVAAEPEHDQGDAGHEHSHGATGAEHSHGQHGHKHAPAPAPLLPGVKNIIAVGAGKGGVGKSTISVLAAIGLARAGAKVGLLDADVYGPSIPKMLGLEDQQPFMQGDKVLPVDGPAGLKVISMGLLVDPGRPIIWRGPMIHSVLQQFLQQVDWGDLDYLVVDLPPGTGDVPLSLAQSIPITGAVVVCTPQDLALADAIRALRMYQQMGVSILGIVENMSYFICPGCSQQHAIFGHGGAQQAAKELNIPFLGAIPININIRVSGDEGTPLAAFERTDEATQQALRNFVETLAGQITIRNETLPPPQVLGTKNEAPACGGHHH